MYTTVPNVWEQALNYRNYNDTDHLTCVRVTPQVGTVSIQLVMGLGADAVGQILYVDDVVVDRVGPAAPPLTPTIAVPPSGIPTFKFQTLTGHNYRMVYKNALTDAIWSTNASMLWIPGTGSEVEATDSSSPLPAARFYRLEIQ